MCQRFQWGHHDLYLHPNLSWVGAEPDKTSRTWVGLTRSYRFQPCILLSWSVDIFLIYWKNIYTHESFECEGSPQRPHDVLPLVCVSCVSVRSAISGEPLSWFSVQEASRACDISPRCFVRELLIGSRVHPPSPNPQHSHQPIQPTCNWAHFSTVVPIEKAMGQSAMMLCLDGKSPAWWGIVLIPHKQQSLYYIFRNTRRKLFNIQWTDNVIHGMNYHTN